MARDIDDREGESPSPMEPRLGRMFHSSATGRRHEQLFLRRPAFVKRRTREMIRRKCLLRALRHRRQWRTRRG